MNALILAMMVVGVSAQQSQDQAQQAEDTHVESVSKPNVFSRRSSLALTDEESEFLFNTGQLLRQRSMSIGERVRPSRSMSVQIDGQPRIRPQRSASVGLVISDNKK